MSKGYQDQVSKFEEVILHNEVILNRQAQDLHVTKADRLRTLDESSHFIKELTRLTEENKELKSSNKDLRGKNGHMHKILYGSTRDLG